MTIDQVVVQQSISVEQDGQTEQYVIGGISSKGYLGTPGLSNSDSSKSNKRRRHFRA